MTDILDESGNLAAALVDRQIEATEGNRRAIRYGEKNYTFHDLAALMNRAGNMLRTLGVERGQPVLLLMPPSPAFFAAALGTMKIGAIVVIPGETVAADSLKDAASRAAPAAVLLDRARFDEFASIFKDLKVVVAGDAPDGYSSLVNLLREAPSSLSPAHLENSAVALTILNSAGARTLTHRELADHIGSGSPIGMQVGGEDLGQMLARLSRSEEITLAPN